VYNRIFGIAGLMFRQAVRSRFVVSLFCLLLTVLVGFTLTIQGDGTASGRLQVLLSYAMGAVGSVLGMATLWLACGSLATEIESRRIHLVVVKPVRVIELWLGKWMGILAVVLLQLVAAGLFMWAAARIGEHRTVAGTPDGIAVREEVLVAREWVEGRRLGPPGDRPVRWSLSCPELPEGATGMATLSYRFLSAWRDQPPVIGHWMLRGEDGRIWFESDCTANQDGVNRLKIPLAQLRGGEPVELLFEERPNAAGQVTGATFHPEREVELLVPTGGFGANLMRALLLLFCHVALLAALGVTAGTLFTFPVAVFASLALVVATLLAQFFVFSTAPERVAHEHHHGGEEGPSWIERVGAHASETVRMAMAPTLRYRVGLRLAEGRRIPWREVQAAAAVLILGYGGVLCLAGCLVLRRREWALPV